LFGGTREPTALLNSASEALAMASKAESADRFADGLRRNQAPSSCRFLRLSP